MSVKKSVKLEALEHCDGKVIVREMKVGNLYTLCTIVPNMAFIVVD